MYIRSYPWVILSAYYLHIDNFMKQQNVAKIQNDIAWKECHMWADVNP